MLFQRCLSKLHFHSLAVSLSFYKNNRKLDLIFKLHFKFEFFHFFSIDIGVIIKFCVEDICNIIQDIFYINFILISFSFILVYFIRFYNEKILKRENWVSWKSLITFIYSRLIDNKTPSHVPYCTLLGRPAHVGKEEESACKCMKLDKGEK